MTRAGVELNRKRPLKPLLGYSTFPIGRFKRDNFAAATAAAGGAGAAAAASDLHTSTCCGSIYHLPTFGILVCDFLQVVIHVGNHGDTGANSNTIVRNSWTSRTLKTTNVVTLPFVHVSYITILANWTTTAHTTVHAFHLRQHSEFSSFWSPL